MAAGWFLLPVLIYSPHVSYRELFRQRSVQIAAGAAAVAAVSFAMWYFSPTARATRLTREGIIAGKNGDLFRASQLLYRAAKVNPSFFLARFNLGLALRGAGRDEQALQEFHAAAVIEPADPQTYYEIARIHAKAKREVSALAALERAIDLGFDNIPLINSDPELGEVNKTQRFKDLWERWETRHQRKAAPAPAKP